MNKVFALVDCNSFFCSCERVFRPELNHHPVGVLSNNDGCFVSLTKELKKLGVPMGSPYFQVKDICKKNKVAVFSSNFSLYTNMSDRVMQTLAEFTPELEVYSVDEAFLNLTGFSNLETYARQIKYIVERWTGIPVSIGIAPTKTLAKAANFIAKKNDQYNGVAVLLDSKSQDEALSKMDVIDVWGMSRATQSKLYNIGINTAKQFRDYHNDKEILKLLTKVGLQRKEELQGKVRFELEMIPEKKKGIMSSRSFGSPVTNIKELREAVASYASAATEKLRQQGSVCSSITVSARTSPFDSTPKYYGSDHQIMLSSTSDTRKIIKYALQALDKLYQAGYTYKKAAVQLSGIRDRDQSQISFLENFDDEKSESLMKSMDSINAKYGPRTVYSAACGIEHKAWTMNRRFKSPNYVSGWGELKKVR